jgi:hypothetical protein
MFSAATGRVAPIQNFASNNLPETISGYREQPSWRLDTPQDVRASLMALRKEFPAAAHIDEMARDLQHGLRGRAAPVVRYRPMAGAALGLLAGSARFTAGLLGISPAVPGTGAAGFNSRLPRAVDSLFMHAANSSNSSNSPNATEPSPAKASQSKLPDGMLSLQWMQELDFTRFDEIAFLQACGETIDDPDSPEERLEAFHRCLQPVFSITRSVLGIEGLDGSSLSAFFEQLYPALGLGELPDQGLDPAFAQMLLNRWFLSMALTPRNEDGGNSDFPLNNLLLGLVQAVPDDDAQHPQPPQMRVDLLRETLEAAFLRGVPARFRPSQKWLVCALFSLYEPTLMRSDAPPALYYGSLEWTLASGFSWLSAALGRGSEMMLQHIHTLPGMNRIAAALKRGSADRKLFYVDDGIWHAAPEAVTVRDSRKYLTLNSKAYSVIDVGGRRNVLALQHGADLHLVNPHSALPYGPPLSADSGARVDASRAFSGLCRTRRAGGAEAGCNPLHSMKPLDDLDELDTLVAMPQFGKHIYRIEGRAAITAFHARAQTDGASVRWVEVDLNFNAFSSEGLAGNKRIKDAPYFAFDGKIWKAVNSRVEQTPIVYTFPDRLEAHVLDLRDSLDVLDGNAGTYLSVTIELPPIPGDPSRYSNRFIVPFASYPGFEGAHHGMAQIGNAPYTFRLSGDWMVRPVNGQRILLEKPALLDVEIFNRYQALNALGTPDVFVRGSVRQLKAADNAARRRFDLVLDRAGELLAAADAALINYGSEANLIMARFTPSDWDGARVAKFHAAIKETLTKLRSALPMMMRHKYEIVGLGNSKLVKMAGTGQAPIQLFNDAAAFRGSMQLDMCYSHLRYPLIVFDWEHFTKSELDRIASDFVHELAHTRVAARDAMSLTSGTDVYPSYVNGEIDVAPLIAAAAAHDSDSARHASTIEHIVMALGYIQSEDTRGLLQRFLDGGTRFSYKQDVPVAGDCFDGSCVVSR